MRNCYLLFLLLITTGLLSAQDTVTVSSNVYTPADITITVGESIVWQNVQGFHNVNGTQATFPSNPESFRSGDPAGPPWLYEKTFNTIGTYNYQCDPHSALGMNGTVTVEAAPTPSMIISGVFDAQPAGAGAKGIEVKLLDDIADMSEYGLGSANNGNGSAGEEFTFPEMTGDAGDCFYIVVDKGLFGEFFGSSDDDDLIIENGDAPNINGDDAIELFFNNQVIDVFGDINASGTGQAWEYTDGWAYRKSGQMTNGGTFNANNWTYSGVDALQGTPNNNAADMPFPLCSYQPQLPTGVVANDYGLAVDQEVATDVKILSNDFLGSGLVSLSILLNPINGSANENGLNSITYTSTGGFCDDFDFLGYEICDASSCDTGFVLIFVNCTGASGYLNTDIATIVADSDGDFEADSLEGFYRVDGTVHGLNLRDMASGLQFTIIDETGEGVGIFNGGEDFGYTVAEGDDVIVRGQLEQFNGLTQIQADSVELVSAGNALEVAEDVDSLNEATESQLVTLRNVRIENTATVGGGINYTVTLDDGREEVVRVDADTDVPTLIEGSTYDVTGIGGQFDPSVPRNSGYQLLPRYLADVSLVTSTINPNLNGQITIFPNPAALDIYIDSKADIDRIEIYNMLGEIISNQEGVRNRIDVSALQNGMYFMKFTTDQGIWTEKFMKN